MIKNLIVNGCSFTRWGKWDEVIANHFGANLVDISTPASGNTAISQTTIEFLASTNYNPSETLILIMWSGIGRIDLPISQDWGKFYETDYIYTKHMNYETYYMLSGGMHPENSWNHHPDAKRVFLNLYKLHDEYSMCKQSLLNFVSLESHLLSEGYHFCFTSFVDYWVDEPFEPVVNELGLNYHIGTDSFYRSYNKKHWIDVECLGNYAVRTERFDDTKHPTAECSREWGEQIMLPAIVDRFSK